MKSREMRTTRRDEYHGQAEIRADEAALQCGDDRARRSRQDDFDGGDDAGIGGQGLDGESGVLRPGGQGVREPGPARSDEDSDDCDEPCRIFDGEPPLRPCRLPGPCGLCEEHDHGGCPDGRGDPGGLGGRRADAPDARAYPSGPSGGRALHRGVPEQGRSGGRSGAVGPGRAGGAGTSDQVQFPRATTCRSSGARRSRR